MKKLTIVIRGTFGKLILTALMVAMTGASLIVPPKVSAAAEVRQKTRDISRPARTSKERLPSIVRTFGEVPRMESPSGKGRCACNSPISKTRGRADSRPWTRVRCCWISPV
jgi:hypothetical protein